MSFRQTARLLGGAFILATGGCTMLPDSGPAHRSTEGLATAALTVAADPSIYQYALVDLNKNVLPFIVDPGPGSLYRTFGTGHGPAPEIKGGIGDTGQVTLFEASADDVFSP